MLNLTEATIEKAFRRKMGARGWLTHKVTATPGWPDRAFLKNGCVIYVEFKRTKGGRLSALQRWTIAEIETAGFVVAVVTDAEDMTIAKIINDAQKKYRRPLGAPQLPEKIKRLPCTEEVGGVIPRPRTRENGNHVTRTATLAKVKKDKPDADTCAASCRVRRVAGRD